MNAICFECSLKKICDKVESFQRRIRWKAYSYDNSSDCNDDDSDQNNNNYGFKSNLTPPPANDHLHNFENAMYDVIKNIEFRIVTNVFQSKLKNNFKEVIR